METANIESADTKAADTKAADTKAADTKAADTKAASGHRQADNDAPAVVSASAVINAPARKIFDLIADPAHHPEWDGNNNVAQAPPGQRIQQVGDAFTASLTTGATRENRIVEFEEGRLIAWLPGEVGKDPFGQLWRWEIQAADTETPGAGTRVTHTYDWSGLPDDAQPHRIRRARATTEDSLLASILRLKEIVERD